MKTAIYKDYEEFLSRKDKNLNGVSVEFAERYPDYENDNVTNKRCTGCVDFTYSINCTDCKYIEGINTLAKF